MNKKELKPETKKLIRNIVIGAATYGIVYLIVSFIDKTLATIVGMLGYGIAYLLVISIIFKKVFKPSLDEHYKNKQK